MSKPALFFSWQADLPHQGNLALIRRALQDVVDDIAGPDAVVILSPEQRCPPVRYGSPRMAGTLLAQIEGCVAFVGDLSPLNHGRETTYSMPNPNVLLELGYALNALAPDRIVGVVNTAYGDPAQLPFDLPQSVWCLYRFVPDKDDEITAYLHLVAQLEAVLRPILEPVLQKQGTQLAPVAIQRATEAVYRGQPAIAPIEAAMTSLVRSLEVLVPDFSMGGIPDELLVAAIEQSAPLVLAFAELCQAVAEVGGAEAALAIYQGFEQILEGYTPPLDWSGPYRSTDFDFHKFVGHELLVSFVACLIQAERWELIEQLLGQPLSVANAQSESGSVPFEYAAQHVELLMYRNRSLCPEKVFLHADILRERHLRGALAEVVPFHWFVAADFFLFLRSKNWHPWSALYINEGVPRYLAEAHRVGYVAQLLPALNMPDVAVLRSQLSERLDDLSRIFWRATFFRPLAHFRLETIGTR